MTSHVSTVTCLPRAISENSCRSILDDMRVSRSTSSFGRNGRADVKLPFLLLSRDRRCKVIIDTNSRTDQASWFQMWEAVQAMYGMCYRFGRGGRAINIGADKQLSLEMGPAF
ncbi:hypothetical protein XPA_001029 [Xanthoria parietina]